jgi:hypothetical protein
MSLECPSRERTSPVHIMHHHTLSKMQITNRQKEERQTNTCNKQPRTNGYGNDSRRSSSSSTCSKGRSQSSHRSKQLSAHSWFPSSGPWVSGTCERMIPNPSRKNTSLVSTRKMQLQFLQGIFFEVDDGQKESLDYFAGGATKRGDPNF